MRTRRASTVTVTDNAGNPAEVSITFPAVAKGDQTLTGFAYSADSVTFGDTAPTLTAPSGAVGTLGYAATASTVCSVNATAGALTIAGVGECEITVTAASTDHYNAGRATYVRVDGERGRHAVAEPGRHRHGRHGQHRREDGGFQYHRRHRRRGGG